MISIEQKMKSIKFYKLFGYSCYRSVSVEKVIIVSCSLLGFCFWWGEGIGIGIRKRVHKARHHCSFCHAYSDIVLFLCLSFSTNWHALRDVRCLWHEI